MKKIIPILKIVAVVIMLQTLFFKFSAADQSVALFTKLAGEHEAYLRVGTGVVELIASILLFIPKYIWLGALITIGVMSGAIMGHLTKLGISHNNDNGLLFGSAIFIFLTGIILFYKERKSIPILGKNFS
jgi:hypothetical protein